jgi:hypothetical protein
MLGQQDSLGGNAKTVIIANLSPAAACIRETQSTLGFAERAKHIVNRVKVNENIDEAALTMRENERLRRELQLLNDTYKALQQVTLWLPWVLSLFAEHCQRKMSMSADSAMNLLSKAGNTLAMVMMQVRPASARTQNQADEAPAQVDSSALEDAEEQWSARLQSALSINQDLETTLAAVQKQANRMRKYAVSLANSFACLQDCWLLQLH